MKLLPQQSTFPPPAETLIFDFPLRADFFFFSSSKVIQQTQREHIQKALYCKLFVVFESFGELIDLRHGREHRTLSAPSRRPSAPLLKRRLENNSKKSSKIRAGQENSS